MKRQKIAVTMGDAAGIGPEIIAKMYLKDNLYKYGDIFVIGDLFPMLTAARQISRKLSIHPLDNGLKINRSRHVINLIDLKVLKDGDVETGVEQKKCGLASYIYLKKAIDLAKAKKIGAIVTAPLNKHSLHMAGVKYPGHTEILAARSKTKKFAMMLAGNNLRVVLVTIHTSIKSVSGLINMAKVLDTIKLTNNSLRRGFKIKKPRIAVLGLNPHAGESGAFGNEEQRHIIPAIRAAQKAGIDAQGPFPPDTIFGRIVKNKDFDAAVCMYHDQGLIPLKFVDFDNAVNVTLGLPFVRTSPDHGTAYDIAGTGKASESSILSALRMASLLAG